MKHPIQTAFISHFSSFSSTFLRTNPHPTLIIFRPHSTPIPSVVSRKTRTISTHSIRTQIICRTYVTQDNAGLTVLNIDGMSRPPPPVWLICLVLGLITWLIRRVIVLRHLMRIYKRDDLIQDIAQFYNLRSAAWERVWGEHMHHGLYDRVDGKRLYGKQAQIRTMTELLRFGGILNEKLPSESHILDVGCGIGGASRYLAQHFGDGCKVTGITLSEYQANRGNEINAEKGLDGRVQLKVVNALNTGFPDDSFDVVWSLESGEHMENKQNFLQECARVLKPGGKMLMFVWCVRESKPKLKVAEKFALRRIMEEYCLPRLAPASEYGTEMLRAGLRGVNTDDWTDRAAPFWGEVARSAVFRRSGWEVLIKYGWPLIRSALAMRYVMMGIKQGAFRVVALASKKPTMEEKELEIANKIGSCSSKSSLPQIMKRR